MKKTYINPEITVVVIETKTQLLNGSGEVGTTSVRMKWNDTADNGEEGM